MVHELGESQHSPQVRVVGQFGHNAPVIGAVEALEDQHHQELVLGKVVAAERAGIRRQA